MIYRSQSLIMNLSQTDLPERIALYIIVQQILLYSHQLKELDTSILVTLSLGFFRAFLSKFQIGLQNNSDFFSNFYIIFPPAV